MLKGAIASTFAANFVTNLLASGSVLVLAIFLQETDIAQVRLIQAYIIIGITIASLGFTTGVLKYCAASDKQIDNWALLNKTIILTSYASLGYIAVVSVAIFTTTTNWDDPRLIVLLPLALISVPLGVVVELFRNFLYAKNQFATAASAQIFVRIWTFAITITLAYAYALSGYVAGTVISFLFGALRFAREVSFKFREAGTAPHTELPSGFLKFSAFAMLGNLFVIAGSYGDILLLDSLDIDRNILGAYALASALAGGIMVITTSIQTVISPDMIRSVASPDRLKKAFIRAQVRLAILSIGVAVCTIFFVAFVFPIIYVDKYRLTPELFAGLCINYVLVSCGTLGGSVLIGYGKTSINTIIAGSALIAGFICGYLLVLEFAVWGMVWAKLIYGLVFVLLSNSLALKQLRTQSNKEFK
ncbi:oligosaccharide flippase family protein [Hydrogenophaga sp. Root209]|uniref:oligosaccharide flippase family protein n=1 Tax=Hydrogenophaga sp. Root209 TaxID=1736490 RepID=UPI0009E92319|nr:oligosaccharide flippase family protein [Hydrogenophaga sp. Root209]